MPSNAEDYRDASGLIPVSADVRAYMFNDLSRIKDDIATIDSRINEAVREANARTETALQQIRIHFEDEIRRLSDLYADVANKLASAVTITANNAEAITELRGLVASLKTSVNQLSGLDDKINSTMNAKISDMFKSIEMLIDNKILKQQNVDNAELPRVVLQEVPNKVSDMDKRLVTLERRMWLINLIGVVLMGLLASFGRELAQMIFKSVHP
jgi:archaellum component FlaC